jgi:hypothetical protein
MSFFDPPNARCSKGGLDEPFDNMITVYFYTCAGYRQLHYSVCSRNPQILCVFCTPVWQAVDFRRAATDVPPLAAWRGRSETGIYVLLISIRSWLSSPDVIYDLITVELLEIIKLSIDFL